MYIYIHSIRKNTLSLLMFVALSILDFDKFPHLVLTRFQSLTNTEINIIFANMLATYFSMRSIRVQLLT